MFHIYLRWASSVTLQTPERDCGVVPVEAGGTEHGQLLLRTGSTSMFQLTNRKYFWDGVRNREVCFLNVLGEERSRGPSRFGVLVFATAGTLDVFHSAGL